MADISKRKDLIRACYAPDRQSADQMIAVLGQYGINAVPGINRDKVGRIGYLQGFKVRYVGRNIQEEAETYSWEPSKEDPDVFTDVPQDGGDHACDAVSYASTHLRRMGIANDYGDNPDRR